MKLDGEIMGLIKHNLTILGKILPDNHDEINLEYLNLIALMVNMLADFLETKAMNATEKGLKQSGMKIPEETKKRLALGRNSKVSTEEYDKIFS